jgi:hypothetical protein
MLFLISCKGNNNAMTDTVKTDSATKIDAKRNSFTPYKLVDDYIVVDTGRYENEGPMGGAIYAIVKKNSLLVDTIDLYFGMKKIKSGLYLYQKLSHERGSSIKDTIGLLAMDTDKYFLITGDTKKEFNTMSPNFDDYFSSPNVINSKVYYWALDRSDTVGNKPYKISAVQYDPVDKKSRTEFLFADYLETDNSGHFANPYIKKDTIYFYQTDKNVWKLSPDFNLYK